MWKKATLAATPGASPTPHHLAPGLGAEKLADAVSTTGHAKTKRGTDTAHEVASGLIENAHTVPKIPPPERTETNAAEGVTTPNLETSGVKSGENRDHKPHQ
jgi:hypothetical protein